MSESESKKLVLDSTFAEMNRLEPFIQELKEWAQFGDDDFNRIMLAVSEAVNNAITHGNDENPDKQVTIKTTLNRSDQLLRISIEDEGDGFDPEAIPNPLKEENLLEEGGRGVFLIKQYADDLQFTKNGTKATISFRLGG